MCGSVVDIQSATTENRRGKKELERRPMPNVMTALGIQVVPSVESDGEQRQFRNFVSCITPQFG